MYVCMSQESEQLSDMEVAAAQNAGTASEQNSGTASGQNSGTVSGKNSGTVECRRAIERVACDVAAFLTASGIGKVVLLYDK